MKQSRFQFSEPSLIALEFAENEGFVIDNNKKISIEANVDVKNKKISDNEAAVSLIVELGGKTVNAPFYLVAEVTAIFNWDNSFDDENIELLLNQNAPALLLSYVRPIVAMTTNSSHFPAYNIPFINFFDKEN